MNAGQALYSKLGAAPQPPTPGAKEADGVVLNRAAVAQFPRLQGRGRFR